MPHVSILFKYDNTSKVKRFLENVLLYLIMPCSLISYFSEISFERQHLKNISPSFSLNPTYQNSTLGRHSTPSEYIPCQNN